MKTNMSLKSLFRQLGLPTREFARDLRISSSTAHRLVQEGRWPTRAAADLPERVADYLATKAKKPEQAALIAELRASAAAPSKKAPAGSHPAEAPSARPHLATPASSSQPQEDSMLLEHVKLSDQAKATFGLTRSPFDDDIQSRDDVFNSPDIRRVRAALMDTAMHHGFMALIGESGAGKTTMREDFEQRIIDEGRPVLVIKPYTLAMEPDDRAGKMMKSGQIAEAIARSLAPSTRLNSSPDARFAQVHSMLRDSCRAGNRHLLVIEEAHRMPMPTLKHLKGWMELKDGLRRLMGVCLMGQTELAGRLSENVREIREIVQRCEKVYMPPLAADLEGYITYKFKRAGAEAAAVLAPDAFDALRARLIYKPRGARPDEAESVCYPQAVNNLLARALNAAAKNGWPKVDAKVVMGC